MPNIIEGQLSATGMKFALVVSRFNHFITDRLVEGCLDALVRHGAADSDITLVRVPGSFEVPPIAKLLAKSGRHDAVIALGAIIRGDTPHFDYLAAEVTKGLAQAGMETDTPVIYGVITTDSLEQAIERAGTKAGNKGADAAKSAIEMVDLKKRLK
ncbi:MAG: 6,7-dimethyl-8-ribityllumazine synthase [candidate division Zixibacteria bacterium]|nr:6,7-dimethyl-8-ribityllumazine synthase [candidate division Zixibacteria bacterium]